VCKEGKLREKTGKEKLYKMTTLHIEVKAIPLQAWRGPEGFRRLRLPDFKTIGT
jgi:hypothetical protein